jgi:tetratricopeptide (TPR) repeat protein
MARLPGQPKDKRELMSARTQAWVLAGVIFLGFCLAFYLGSVPLVVLGVAVALMWVFHYLFMTRVLMPTGDSTPGDKPLSHIDAMVARGDYQGAATAYDREIQADAADFWSCERLAMLARSHLKDPELAVRALRQAEQRVPEPRRRAGYALLALGVIRDDLRDQGRAIVELRRILTTYPGIPNADALRVELDQMKAERFREP